MAQLPITNTANALQLAEDQGDRVNHVKEKKHQAKYEYGTLFSALLI